MLAPSGSGIRAAAAAIDSSAPKVFQRNRAHGKDLLDLDRVLSRATVQERNARVAESSNCVVGRGLGLEGGWKMSKSFAVNSLRSYYTR